MGVTLRIDYDKNDPFVPGQIITGTVTLLNDSRVKVKGLTIRFYGEANVYWTESELGPGDHPTRPIQKEFRNELTLFSDEIVLLGQANEEGGTDLFLHRGLQKYRFQYQLPQKSLPPTLTNLPYGSIKYTSEVRLKKRLFSYESVEKEFIIKEIVDLSSIPSAKTPTGASNRLDLGLWCCTQGYVNVVLKTDKTGYNPGENIVFMASIVNLSNEQIEQVWVTFTQTVLYSTHGRTKRETSDIRRVLLNTRDDGSPTWNEFIQVPNGILASTFSKCELIKIAYDLRLTLRTSNKRTCRARCPIIIGTRVNFSDLEAMLLASMAEGQDCPSPDFQSQTREYDPRLNPFLESYPQPGRVNELYQGNSQCNDFEG